MFTREQETAARPTTALAHQESNLRADLKSLGNAAFAPWDGFTLRVAFHSEMVLDRPADDASLFSGVRLQTTACGCVDWRGMTAITDADARVTHVEPPPGNTEASATMKGRSHQPGPYHLRLGVARVASCISRSARNQSSSSRPGVRPRSSNSS